MDVIRTSPCAAPSDCAPATSCISTDATRLWTVWNDWRASRSLVSRKRRPSDASELDRDLRVLAQQAAHVAAEDRDRLGVVERLDRRRAPLVVEHRQLAEDVAGTEVGERDRAAVGVLAHGASSAVAHDVTRAALVALAEDDLSGYELARNRDFRHARKLVLAQLGEHGDGAKQRDCVFAGQPPCGQGYQITQDRGRARAGDG